MNEEQFRAEQEKLATERREADNRLSQARTSQGIVKQDHDKLTSEMLNAVTPEDRNALQPQVAESAEKLKNANAIVQERQSEVNVFEEREHEAHKVEQRMEEVATQAEKLAEVGSETATQVGHLLHGEHAGHFDLGGTSKPIGDAVSWATNVTVPYVQGVGGVQNAVRLEVENAAAKAEAFADSVEAKLREVQVSEPVNISEKLQGIVDKFTPPEKKEQELPDAQKLEKENEAHEQNVSQMTDLQGKISKQLEEDDSQKNIDKLIKETQTVIKEQDQRTRDSFDGNSAIDPAARQQQFQSRVENEKEVNAQRYETVNELLKPMAEANVLDQHFQTLEKEAENNRELLKMNENRLKDQPDAKRKQEQYETELNDNLAAKEKALDARWEQDVQQELGGLRREHFPEVRPPEIEGPALAQSGPSQFGPGGGAGSGAPQQQGPAGPAM